MTVIMHLSSNHEPILAHDWWLKNALSLLVKINNSAGTPWGPYTSGTILNQSHDFKENIKRCCTRASSTSLQILYRFASPVQKGKRSLLHCITQQYCGCPACKQIQTSSAKACWLLWFEVTAKPAVIRRRTDVTTFSVAQELSFWLQVTRPY